MASLARRAHTCVRAASGASHTGQYRERNHPGSVRNCLSVGPIRRSDRHTALHALARFLICQARSRFTRGQFLALVVSSSGLRSRRLYFFRTRFPSRSSGLSWVQWESYGRAGLIRDDVRGLSPLHRLGSQFAAALLLWLHGWRVPIPKEIPASGTLSLISTILFVIAMTNAFNLFDGADGAAGGVAVIIATAYSVLPDVSGSALAIAVAANTATALAPDFWFFRNFPPAKIFLGDSGSTSARPCGCLPGIRFLPVPLRRLFTSLSCVPVFGCSASSARCGVRDLSPLMAPPLALLR